MFSGIKKYAANLQGLKRVFNNMPKINSLIEIYGLSFETFPDADINFPLTDPFYQAFSQKGMIGRFQDLVKNLDDQSKADVADIINGVLQVGKGYKKASALIKNGAESMRKLNEYFYDRIIKLSDDLYTWQGYYLPTNHFDPACLYYRNGIDFLDHPEHFLGNNIIDAGGFVGDSILVLSQHTNASIYSFEPVPAHVNLMQRTMELNHISNAIIEPAALSDACGDVEINLDGEICGGASLGCSLSSSHLADVRVGAQSKIMVKQTTLDNYVKEKDINGIGLIKMDVEGAEIKALLGAEKSIRQFRPSLLISIYHNPSDFFNIKPMIESWNLGYKIKIRRCPGYLFADTMLVAEV